VIYIGGHSTGGAIAVRYMDAIRVRGIQAGSYCSSCAKFDKASNFPYGIDEETVLEMIEGTYNDRPQMLKNFGDRFFFQRTSRHFPIGSSSWGCRRPDGNGSDCKDMDK